MSRTAYPVLVIALGALGGPLFVSPAAAEEVQWRANYAAARREAQEKNRPLLVDFGTRDCFFCKKLDAITFRDPAVLSVVNQQYIPVKVDADAEPHLAQALRIQSYPTVILAAPDGRIIGTLEGYLEPAQFHHNLLLALKALPKTEVASRPAEPPATTVSAPAPSGLETSLIRWRHDYNAARAEAQEKAKPLALDFGTADCLHCKRLEASTFRDPSIVQLLNEHFIPLRIDADKDAQLVQFLRVQKFPTIILAAPDGRILGTFEGYLEAARLSEYLQRALVSVTNPEWMLRDYQAASKAIAHSDYARAIALLRSVTEDGMERPIQLKARQLLQDLEQQAAGRLARAKQLEDKGQSAEAMETLTDLMRVFAGTQAAAEAGQLLNTIAAKPEIKQQQRTRRARELLAQAKEDYRTQQFLCCLDRCEVLASSYGDLPEGLEGMQLASEIKNNPEWMRKACNDLSDRLCTLYLAQAETWLKKGQPQQAVACLERVIQGFPGTSQAEAAQVRLAQIQGQPTRQATFNNP
ncbi:MAG: thioredoxin family protein [Gemmataceae bacterium]|nr:thioredoxin family protein [Gemmataceae bacterium]MDW8265747.1 thioredoxin family protein [Gemmataceae bacterium]